MMRLDIPDVKGPVQNERWAIEGVPAEQAHIPWQRCWTLLQKAVDRFPQVALPLTPEGVFAEVSTGNAQLWIAWSYRRRRIEGVVITRLVKSTDIPNKLLCEAPLVAGENLPEWGGEMLGLIRAWSKSQGAAFLIGYGRRGWKRLFGFTEYGRNEDGLPILVLPVE